ncbi:MAG: glycoside hydrolase family 3 C-terminal domain-containing protein [Rhodanobacter sp.]
MLQGKVSGVLALMVALAPLPLLAFTPAATAPDGVAARVDKLVQRMPPDALHHMVQSYAMMGMKQQPAGSVGAAGYVPALPAYGIPALQENDSGAGVNNYPVARDARGWPVGVRGKAGDATALPSPLGMAATWNPRLAAAAGAMIAGEARAQGINVLLGPGVNLAREPRDGRTFEFFGEDPLLAGTIAGAEIRGIQSRHVIATLKHYALNDQETNRLQISSNLSESAARESDLFAFELAIEQGHPGAVMCGYNKVNGVYDCSDAHLLSAILKHDWKYRGWVMTDWGADHGASDALAGLDQVSGEDFAAGDHGEGSFGAPLMRAVANDTIPFSRLQDMVRRILYSMMTNGLFVTNPVVPLDVDADARVAQDVAAQALVLLKNDHALLPLGRDVKRIALIGGHADAGVLSGGGSAQVWPIGGPAIKPVYPDLHDSASPWIVYDPSSPLKALQQRLPQTRIDYDDGSDPARAAALANKADVVIVFATQWEAEGIDLANLSLPDHQDQLIGAVSSANPHTVVVLETGSPVRMPWLAKVAAVLEAWYPGARGGAAIADVLSGRVDPSGRLPVTFPRNELQLPRPQITAADAVDYNIEGAAVGYKWYDEKHLSPLFPFGYGLAYTQFGYAHLRLHQQGARVIASFEVSNNGDRAGLDTPQVYVDMPTNQGGAPRRLAGFDKVLLRPGQRKTVSITIDPRLFAVFDVAADRWRIGAGRYTVQVGHSSRDFALSSRIRMNAADMAP